LNTLGRSASCTLVIQSSGVSKEHAHIEVIGDKIFVTDLGSRNGTLVNGTRIQRHRLQVGDKLGIYDIIFDVNLAANMTSQHYTDAPVTNHRPTQASTNNPGWSNQPPPPDFSNDELMNGYYSPKIGTGNPAEQAQSPSEPESQIRGNNISDYIHHYIENVAMPAIYRLIELTDFRVVVAIFVALTIILTSALSTIIMLQVSKDSIVTEAKRRTATLANMLQEMNRAAIASSQNSALDVTRVAKEEGVTEALIVATDGQIIAPPIKAGTFSKNTFVAQAIRSDRSLTDRIDNSAVGSSVPVYVYNQNIGRQIVQAYAVVIYELDALAADDSQFVILFVKTLLLAALFGLIIWYFLVRITEYPIESINRQIDKALRNGQGQTDTAVLLRPLKFLVDNINSALSRTSLSGHNDQNAIVYSDRDSESQNLVQLIGLPALILDGQEDIIKYMNQQFETVTGLSFANLQRQPLGAITDQALKLSLQDLVARSRQQPHLIANDVLDFAGENYELCVQAVHGEKGIAYYIVLLQPPPSEQVQEAGGF
jgi:pSer/pThr/pTyr-binding forkhead associated (FHA) protein